MLQLPRHDASDTERLVFAETTLMSLYVRLYGNGQPGDIEKIHKMIGSVNKKLDDLDKFRWKLVGAFGFISLIPLVIEIIRSSRNA